MYWQLLLSNGNDQLLDVVNMLGQKECSCLASQSREYYSTFGTASPMSLLVMWLPTVRRTSFESGWRGGTSMFWKEDDVLGKREVAIRAPFTAEANTRNGLEQEKTINLSVPN